VKKLYSRKVCPPSQSLPNEFSIEVAVTKMRDEGFAIQGEAVSLYTMIERTFSDTEKCSLSEIEALRSETLYTFIQKGSPYRKLFTLG
jgi:hypothetical protein